VSPRAALALILPLLLAGTSRADVMALTWDNDIFFRTDANYTNGVRLSWLGKERPSACDHCAAVRTARALSWLPGLNNADAVYSLGINLDQVMITPRDLSVTTPQFDDVPYAGLLMLDVGLYARTDRSVTAYMVSLGTTGPDSGAEQSQRMVHRWTLSDPPQGWANQLPGKVVGGVAAVHSRLLYNTNGPLTRQAGVAFGGRADGWLGSFTAGLFMRVGQKVPNNLLPDYAGNGSSAALAGLQPVDGLGWSLFAGISAEGIGWNYLEYEGKRAGYAVETEDLVGAAILGGSVQRGRFATVLSLHQSSSYTRDNDRFINFGTLAFIWQY
jgi:lipid A 3-O-deacylase